MGLFSNIKKASLVNKLILMNAILFFISLSYYPTAHSGSIFGRVYVDNTPSVNAKVAVYLMHHGALDPSKKIAEVPVTDGPGLKDDGHYRIGRLPDKTKLLVIATEPPFNGYRAMKKIKLKAGKPKKVNLTIRLGSNFGR